jgi:hypothetical protein
MENFDEKIDFLTMYMEELFLDAMLAVLRRVKKNHVDFYELLKKAESEEPPF